MARLEWVTEVNEIFVSGGRTFDEDIKRVNQALSEGWRLLEVYPYHSGDPRDKGAIGTVYVLGRAVEGEAEDEGPLYAGASGVPGPPSSGAG